MSATSHRQVSVALDSADFIAGDSETARLMRHFDWACTPLGPPSGWSPSLRMMVRFVLANRFPHLLWWGPDYIQIYNDPYIPVLGAKHPEQSLGKPVRECWHEVYDVLRPLVDTPFNGGPATWAEDMELIVRRHGFPEESHFTIAYSAVPDDTAPRGIGGVLATVHEISEKVIGQRRVQLLSELSARLAEAKTAEDACETATNVVARHPKDLPFALVYLVDEASGELRRCSSAGIAEDATGPASMQVDDAAGDLPLLLAQALRTETLQVVHELSSLLPRVPPGPWPDPPHSAVVLPIKSNIARRPAGLLVLGISACIRLDPLYTSFVEFFASQVATAIANARAYEEERRRAAALAEIDRAKTAFFSNVSHEFRTPLTLMLGPLEDVLAAPGTPASTRSTLEVAHRNAQRLLKLVNSLLDFARIEAGRIQSSFAPVDLAALTADLSSTFRSAMERAGLDYDVRCEPIGEPVYVDREMWEKIVLNLLSNAFKYTLSGAVRVHMHRERDHAVLEVADTGVGVAEREIPRLFERFYRVEGTKARTHEGSGIGLALVQELVKLHSGTIDVTSTLGRGTTFTVRIPLGTAHVARERVKSAALGSTSIASQAYVEEALRWLPDEPGTTGSKAPDLVDSAARIPDSRFASTYHSRILLADDNADMRSYVRELLGTHYQVEAVVDGESALQAARRSRPDLILSDVMMPRLDGFGLLKALRADPELHNIPLILLSARAGEESRIEGLGAGADDYIVKPFHAREFLARVGALLELSRTRRESEQQFRAYVEATTDAVYRMSPDWSELRYLEGRNFILDQTNPSGRWPEKYIHPDDQPRVMEAIGIAIRTKTPFQLEHRVIRADGSPGWTMSRAIPLLDEDGEIIEWFGAASDVTERRETQEALRRQQQELEAADRQKNEFLAMLAHELRNPLAPIRNANELLLRRFSNDPDVQSTLGTVSRQVTHLTRLVDDLLDISRITLGRIELRRKPVTLSEVTSRALETIEPLLSQKGLRIAVVSSRRPLVVNADPDRLIQCIGNILTNAAKYSDEPGEIRVEMSEIDGQARIAVTDHGVGISSELLPKVFDLFVQGERTLDRSQGGLGVGLSIVRRIIEMHGGSVGVSSPGINQGSTFEIRLPLAEVAAVAANGHAVPSCAPRRILVVDDNRDAALTLSSLLSLDGHEVQCSFSGPQALEDVEWFRPDLVLLDIGLPGLDGYEVARRIREKHVQTIHLVAITGYGQHTDRERARTAGFADHLVKPVEYSKLQHTLTAITSQKPGSCTDT